MINIIDDDDCGPTTCWLSQSSCGGNIAAGAAEFPSNGNIHMAGTVGAFPVDWTVRMRHDQEDGYRRYVCVSCDNDKQALTVNYGPITMQQVRNCATSLVLRQHQRLSDWNGYVVNSLA